MNLDKSRIIIEMEHQIILRNTFNSTLKTAIIKDIADSNFNKKF